MDSGLDRQTGAQKWIAVSTRFDLRRSIHRDEIVIIVIMHY